MRKKPPIKLAPNIDTLFALAIVKGVIEHDDGTSYFASLGGYEHHLERARAREWVRCSEIEGELDKLIVTDAGREVYERCKLSAFPQTYGHRAYAWNWTADNNPD